MTAITANFSVELGVSGPPGPSTAGLALPAGVAIAAGALVNIYSLDGVATAQLADASLGLPADGFASAEAAEGAPVFVFPIGPCTGLEGLTPGAQYYLGEAGGLSLTQPLAPPNYGYIIQAVGKATSATSLAFIRGDPVGPL